jgi:hypothetical protein
MFTTPIGRLASVVVTAGLASAALTATTAWGWQRPPAPPRVAAAATGSDTASEPASQQEDPYAIHTSSFAGITPGVSTLEDIRANWGEPLQSAGSGDELRQIYQVEPFAQVAVRLTSGSVRSIVVDVSDNLADSSRVLTAAEVARQLDIEHFQPTRVLDDSGNLLGIAYPERGVLLGFGAEPSAERVRQIILEPVTAHAFLLRAQERANDDYTGALADIELARQYSPQPGYGQWLRAKVLYEAGRYADAAQASQEAIVHGAEHPEHRIVFAQSLGKVGHHREAIEQMQQVIAMTAEQPHVQALATVLLGKLLATNPDADLKTSVQHYLRAIEIAEPIASDENELVRRAALEVLLDAHLGAAHAVALGPYKNKQMAITKWLEEADKISQELSRRWEGRAAEYQFRTARGALQAYAAVREQLDPLAWTQQAISSGRHLLDSTRDPMRKHRLEWELGTALYDSLHISYRRREQGPALKHGMLAVAYLESAAEQIQQVPDNDYLFARLYFRIGAVHAILRGNHDEALPWFDKTMSLLRGIEPQTASRRFAARGEMLVSMGVSYWQTGHRDEAVQMTLDGAALIEHAVEQRVVEVSALRVPYRNLSTMYRRLGNTASAERYSKLAEQYDNQQGGA